MLITGDYSQPIQLLSEAVVVKLPSPPPIAADPVSMATAAKLSPQTRDANRGHLESVMKQTFHFISDLNHQ